VLFNTVTYAYFFATVFIVSWLFAPWRRARLGFLLVASYVFYAGWTFVGFEALRASFPGFSQLFGAAGTRFWMLVFESIKYVPLLFCATSIDFHLGVALGRLTDPRRRKLLLLGTIALNVGILVFFKYWNWGADSFTWLMQVLFDVDIGDIHLRVELPIGISFFCFMSLSYVIDVYRGTIPYCRSYLDYLTYISFFPHLVAGPIIRGRDLLPHLERDTHLTAETGGEGLFLIAAGLFKKVVIGDYIAVNFVDRVFAEPASYSAVEAMAAMYGYAVQVYCDFAGYSDVAIGSALLLGYRFKINFDAPFKSTNIVEFWRRWHISLSTWLRDYVYIPLGGSRKGDLRQYLNIFLTMLICGVWHGAAWTYFVFGCIQGVAVGATHWVHEVRKRQRPWRELLLALAVTVALWLGLRELAGALGRPGLALLVGALLAGAWLVVGILALAGWIEELAKRDEGLARILDRGRQVHSVVVVAAFLATLMWLVRGVVHDWFEVILPYRYLLAVALVVAGPLGWRYVRLRPTTVLGVVANFTFVALTFTMFRAASLDKAWAMYERLLSLTTYTPNLHQNVLLVILGALLLQWTPRKIYDRARELFILAPAPVQATVLFAVALALREAASSEAVPFVYFQF
jgi:D-alanyl-lipoteichoic acid acyltransferase DltB (MBOAT superfamily)